MARRTREGTIALRVFFALSRLRVLLLTLQLELLRIHGISTSGAAGTAETAVSQTAPHFALEESCGENGLPLWRHCRVSYQHRSCLPPMPHPPLVGRTSLSSSVTTWA